MINHELFGKLILLSFLLTSCSLLRVDTCGDDGYTEIVAKDWASCKAACDAKDRYAYAGMIFSSKGDEKWMCGCGEHKE